MRDWREQADLRKLKSGTQINKKFELKRLNFLLFFKKVVYYCFYHLPDFHSSSCFPSFSVSCSCVCLSTFKSLLSVANLHKFYALVTQQMPLSQPKRAVHLSDVVLRFCITVSHLNRALYFACDNVLWAGKSGLAPVWIRRSGPSVLSGLIFFYPTRSIYSSYCLPCLSCE